MPTNKVQLAWEGKAQAIEESETYDCSNYKLTPNIEKSINFDTTNNIIIEGDKK